MKTVKNLPGIRQRSQLRASSGAVKSSRHEKYEAWSYGFRLQGAFCMVRQKCHFGFNSNFYEYPYRSDREYVSRNIGLWDRS